MNIKARDPLNQKWIVVKGSGGGGLGDRLRAVITGLIYANATGRGLVVDWRDSRYGATGDNAFTQLFCLRDIATVEPETLAANHDVWPASWAGRLDRSMHDVYVEDGDPPWNRADAIARYSFDLSRWDYTQDVLVMWEFDQLSKLQGDAYFNPEHLETDCLTSSTAHRFLFPSTQIKEQLDALLSPLSSARCIGVHVRNTWESVEQKGRVSLDEYWRAVDRWMGTQADEVFLATDNRDVVVRFRKRYGDDNVIVHEKWFGDPGDSLHLNPECPDSARAAEAAVVEIYALSKCNFLITQQNSSFSMIARILSVSSSERQVVLTPKLGWKQRVRKLIDENTVKRVSG